MRALFLIKNNKENKKINKKGRHSTFVSLIRAKVRDIPYSPVA